jgi:hemolysin D
MTNPSTAPEQLGQFSRPDSDDWSSLTKEMIDTLPRVWTRGFVYLLVLLLAIVLPWAMLSKVDETGSARGQLEPEGRTLKLDAPVQGTIAAIKVKEGEKVKAGQILLELESEIVRTDLLQAQARLEGQLNRVTQLEFLKNQLSGVTIRAQQLQSKADVAAQLAQIDQTRQRLNHNIIMRQTAENRLARDQIEVERYRALAQQGIVPEVKVVEVERAMDETRWNLNQARSDINQAQYQIQAQQNQYKGTIRSGELTILGTEQRTKEIQSQIADTQADIAQTQEQIQLLQLQLRQRVMRSPVDGTIFQLAVKTAGSVLQTGQEIVQIAPQGADFIFRAEMPTQESGFLRVGMPVKLKFDAYPFQDYGTVAGRLRRISPDSKPVESAQGKTEVFELEIALEQRYIQGQNRREVLTPGQTATAEVIVRQRRVIDFILDPFKQLQAGGLEL